MNPGQSVKDRAALGIIQDAIKSGHLQPGGTIVEGTAGNTGIGLALVGASMGYKTVIVIPETQSQEKKDMIRLAGATLIEVPAKPYKDDNNYIKYSARLANKLAQTEPNGAIWANQFDNVANRNVHITSTAPEIYTELDGKLDGFICSVGTGGTLAGTAMGLREKSKDIKIGLADPDGAAIYNYYANGELKSSGDSITEGIGQGRITANLEGLEVDMPYNIPDSEALPVIFDLLQNEGLCMGGSTGINIAGAIRMARDMGPGHSIVTILADYGTRYQSKIFNPKFLKAMNLPVPGWLDGKSANIPSVFE
jgi:cysteine synthase A